jgi:NAD(P)H-hydrate epimerase
MSIPKQTGSVPALTTAQMVEVDRLMIEDYHIQLIQMMENAGRNLAQLARVRFLGGDPRGKTVVVAAGTGGNGGGALVCARHLSNWGAGVRVISIKPDADFTRVPAHQLAILRQMGLQIALATEAKQVVGTLPVDLIVDGIIGYSLSGAPHGAAADLIRWANARGVPVLALDAPSGLDASSGTIFDPAIKATATLTLALPKHGLLQPGARAQVGELYLADISVPPSLYSEPSLGISIGHLFARSEIIRLG